MIGEEQQGILAFLLFIALVVALVGATLDKPKSGKRNTREGGP